jgi:hypothetical protein
MSTPPPPSDDAPNPPHTGQHPDADPEIVEPGHTTKPPTTRPGRTTEPATTAPGQTTEPPTTLPDPATEPATTAPDNATEPPTAPAPRQSHPATAPAPRPSRPSSAPAPRSSHPSTAPAPRSRRPSTAPVQSYRTGPVVPEPAPQVRAPAGRRESEQTARPDHRPGDHAGQPGSRPRSLADRQAELVEALTTARPVPEGFAGPRVEAARVALLRKRAGEVARQWPLLAAGLGDGWTREFAEWAKTRPTQGSLRDGWDLARALHGRGALPAVAAEELAVREAAWRYDGNAAPRPRRGPAIRVVAGSVAVQVGGRVHLLWPRP